MIDPNQMRNNGPLIFRLALGGVAAVVGIVLFATGFTFEGEIFLFIAVIRILVAFAFRNRVSGSGGGVFMVQQGNNPMGMYGQAGYTTVPVQPYQPNGTVPPPPVNTMPAPPPPAPSGFGSPPPAPGSYTPPPPSFPQG